MKLKNRMKILKNSFFLSTLIVIGSGFIIKVLGLINKIIITRLLGTEGMALYIMAFPTIMLFINISSMSLNVATSKLVAESLKTKRYSPKQLIKKSFKITLIVSTITIGLLFLIINYLTKTLLQNPNLYYPLLTTVILIPLVGITDTLKGYFNGLKKSNITSLSQLIEQIFRILFSILFLFVLLPYGIVIATTFTLLALSIGELASIIYLLRKIKKYPPANYENTKHETKAILEIAVPTTFNRLIGNFTYFLEPIIYTFCLSKMAFTPSAIQEQYTIINAYAIPLLTTASFLSYGIATTLIPSISENHVLNKKHAIAYLTKKTIIYALIPGVLIAILLFLYPNEYMKLIYDTHEGTIYIKGFVFLFLLYYIQAPIVAILQATNHAKAILITSISMNVLRLFLIGTFSFIPGITTDSIFYAILITLILSTIILTILVFSFLKIKIAWNSFVNLTIVMGFTLSLGLLIEKTTSLHYLISSIIIAIIYFLNCRFLKLLDIKSLKKEKTNT